MKGGEILNIKVITDPVMIALEKDEQNRLIDDPVVNPGKKRKYSEAIKIAKGFFTPGRGNILAYDLPERKLEYHVMIVQLVKEDFFDDEVRILSQIIQAFNGVRITGDTDQNIILEFLFEGIYSEEEGA